MADSAADTIAQAALDMAWTLAKRDAEEPDTDEPRDPEEAERISSWALFIQVMLVVLALFCSYYLQLKKIQAVHETVVSIFAGMVVGLAIRLSPGEYLQSLVNFDYKIFFNVLLPPIILNSGYELHQGNFFRNIGSILTFAFLGTFMSAVSLAAILWAWAWLPFESLSLSFIDALSVGATLSATDPVTILAIFKAYKVDPKLYTIIFGESILNDAVAIVMFETANQFKHDKEPTIGSLFKGVGIFLAVFTVSLLVGVLTGIATALTLKHTYIRRFPGIESCLILLVAYASYLFSNGCHMSGIVSLLFCGITLKHYAYYNMSRRTQLTTKYLFSVLAQLSENFIFIYLGLSLFTDDTLTWRPLFILITLIGICVARYIAVFPLSNLINWFIRRQTQSRLARGTSATSLSSSTSGDEIPRAYQGMLFWAGLRGAVGVALAAGFMGESKHTLRATVLVVVVLTVILFGGTTARMLEILGIRTGVVEEVDSDDEFDIESTGLVYKNQHAGGGFTNVPNLQTGTGFGGINVPLGNVTRGSPTTAAGYASGSGSQSPVRPLSAMARRSTVVSQQQTLLGTDEDSDIDSETSDLPPQARRDYRNNGGSSRRYSPPAATPPKGNANDGENSNAAGSSIGYVGQLAGIWRTTAEDQVQWFRKIDDEIIKPTLLLDPKSGGGVGPGQSGGGMGM